MVWISCMFVTRGFAEEKNLALDEKLGCIVSGLEAKYQQSLGICIKVGNSRQMGEAATYQHGSWQTGYAWSTIKVPIAIAALRNNNNKDNIALAKESIYKSDNASNKKLLDSIQPFAFPEPVPLVIKDKLNEVFHQTGCDQMEFHQQWLGLTKWSLQDEAIFMLGLQKVDGFEVDYVRDLMRNIYLEHRFGLGRISGMMFKTGCGEVEEECIYGEEEGTYTGYDCRQMGYYALSDSKGVAIAIGTTSPIDPLFLQGRNSEITDDFNINSRFGPWFKQGRDILDELIQQIFPLLQ